MSEVKTVTTTLSAATISESDSRPSSSGGNKGTTLISVKRPGYGTLGQKIKLYANHFKIEIPKQGSFYHYDIDIQLLKSDKPPKETGAGDVKKPKASAKPPPAAAAAAAKAPAKLSKPLKRKIWRIFLAASQTAPAGLLHKIIPVFDGEKNIYTMKPLKIGKDGSSALEITIPEDAEGGARQAIVTVKACVPLEGQWSLLQDALDGKSREVPIAVFQCINTVFREAAIADINRVAAGRSFYWRENSNRMLNLNGGMECWPGSYSSARPCQWKVTLNLDVANTAFYKEQMVLAFLMETLRIGPQNFDPQRHSRDFEREIKGIKVEFNNKGAIRRYRVTKVSKQPANQQTFDCEGKKITVASYFKDHHNITLQHPHLPCLEVGNKGNLLPMEVCKIFGGQKVQRKLSEEQTALMVRHCAQPAFDRKARIMDIRQKMQYDTNAHLKEFGITVEKDLKQIDGRILPKPTMGQGGAAGGYLKEVMVNDAQGTWEPRNMKFVIAQKLLNWWYIGLDDRTNLDMFFDSLIAGGEERGMNIAKPNRYAGQIARDPNFVEMFKNIVAQNKGNKPDLIMVILRGKSTTYADVKKAGDVVLGIPTQCVLGNNIYKHTQKGPSGMGQLTGNILLKINVKLGGSNSIVMEMVRELKNPSDPSKNVANQRFLKLMQKFVEKPTIVFGCDVTHPSPGEGSQKPSIAAVVASYDSRFTRYYSRVRAQGHRKEIVTDLRDMVAELLIEFRHNAKGTKPARIIFYRDGVSEGQYLDVLKQELTAVQQACKKVELDYTPPITYVIVGKRHHTRLFPIDQNSSSGKAGNVKPGTITDKDICHFSEFDFFLCSHYGLQGTSRPAHYNVLYDDANFSADEIQMFSYYLTFVYARCNRSVSIPAPAYYAHHVAFRARHHLEDRNEMEIQSVASGNSDQSIPLDTIKRMNDRIKVHENLKGMYFA